MAVKADNTGKKQLPEAMKETSFKPGESGNLAGRPKGTRNKFSEVFLKDFLSSWEEGGIDALKKVRDEDPAAFLRVAASLLPKDINVNTNQEAAFDRFIEGLNDEQLDNLIAGLVAVGSDTEGATSKNKKGASKQSRSVH